MDDQAAHAFNVFADPADKGALHPVDWRRFYDFIITAHRNQLDVSEIEVHNLVWGARFPDDTAKFLQSLFSHGRDLLQRYDELKQQPEEAR
jgi:hypothetical protein